MHNVKDFETVINSKGADLDVAAAFLQGKKDKIPPFDPLLHDNESKSGYNFEETLGSSASKAQIKKYHLDRRRPTFAVGGKEKLPEYRE